VSLQPSLLLTVQIFCSTYEHHLLSVHMSVSCTLYWQVLILLSTQQCWFVWLFKILFIVLSSSDSPFLQLQVTHIPTTRGSRKWHNFTQQFPAQLHQWHECLPESCLRQGLHQVILITQWVISLLLFQIPLVATKRHCSDSFVFLFEDT
jgi:hypothetical protein